MSHQFVHGFSSQTQEITCDRLAVKGSVPLYLHRGAFENALRVGIGHSMVSNWLAASTYPETTRGPYVSRLDPYLPYLFQRWVSCWIPVLARARLRGLLLLLALCECQPSFRTGTSLLAH